MVIHPVCNLVCVRSKALFGEEKFIQASPMANFTMCSHPEHLTPQSVLFRQKKFKYHQVILRQLNQVPVNLEGHHSLFAVTILIKFSKSIWYTFTLWLHNALTFLRWVSLQVRVKSNTKSILANPCVDRTHALPAY